MKKTITLYLVTVIFLLSGCSAKNGAIIGGTTGAIAGGLLGAGISKQHVGNGKTAQTALQVGLVLGIVGALLGAGTGYIVDKTSQNEDTKMKEIISSAKQVEAAK